MNGVISMQLGTGHWKVVSFVLDVDQLGLCKPDLKSSKIKHPWSFLQNSPFRLEGFGWFWGCLILRHAHIHWANPCQNITSLTQNDAVLHDARLVDNVLSPGIFFLVPPWPVNQQPIQRSLPWKCWTFPESFSSTLHYVFKKLRMKWFIFLNVRPNSLDERRGYDISTSTIKEWIVMIVSKTWTPSWTVGYSKWEKSVIGKIFADLTFFVKARSLGWFMMQVYLIKSNFATVRGSHLKI